MEWSNDEDDMLEMLADAEEQRAFDEAAAAAAAEAEARWADRRHARWTWERMNQGGWSAAELEAAVREAEEDRPALEQRLQEFERQQFDPTKGYWSEGQFVSYEAPGEDQYADEGAIQRTERKRSELRAKVHNVIRDFHMTQRQTKPDAWMASSQALARFWTTSDEVFAHFFHIQDWLYRTWEHSTPESRHYWVDQCVDFVRLAVNPHRNHMERYRFFKFLVFNGCPPDLAKRWCYVHGYNYNNQALRDLDQWMQALERHTAGLPLIASDSDKLDTFFQRNATTGKMKIPNIYSYERVWK